MSRADSLIGIVLALIGPMEDGLVLVDDVAALVAVDAGVIVIATDVSICEVVGALGDRCVFRVVVERLGMETPSFICSDGEGGSDGRFIAGLISKVEAQSIERMHHGPDRERFGPEGRDTGKSRRQMKKERGWAGRDEGNLCNQAVAAAGRVSRFCLGRRSGNAQEMQGSESNEMPACTKGRECAKRRVETRA